MKLSDIYSHHLTLSDTHGTEIKLYAECVINNVDQQVIRTHLDSQSIGPLCKGLHPTYRSLSTSLQTVMAASSQSVLPELCVDGSICCYRSVLCEPTEDPTHSVQFSTQSIHLRHTVPLKHPTNSMLRIESVCDHQIHKNIILPEYVQKENGTTYIPLQDNAQSTFIIEVFQIWRASTFAELEYKSISIPTNKERYGVRISAIPSSNITQTPQTLHNITTRLAKFLDLLVYG